MKLKYNVKGLDCAVCAQKIEDSIKNITGIKTAEINFASGKLFVETESESTPDIEKIKQVIDSEALKAEPEAELILTDGKTGAVKEEESNENRKDIIKIIAGGAVFIAGAVLKLPDHAELGVFLLSYLILGSELLLRAAKSILRGDVFNEYFLMGITTIGAFAIGEYPEGAAVMLFYSIGELLQNMAVNRSKKSISKLMDIRPEYVNLYADGKITVIKPEEAAMGDVFIVRPGEKIPLDGIVAEGNSDTDVSSLTGESMPREIGPGDEALSGSVNGSGLLKIKATREYAESTVSKILELVENASGRKAVTEKFITKFARYYTPSVVAGAALLAVLPPLLFSGQLFSVWIYRALVVLAVSCPCALVISVPLTFFGAIGGASVKGILFKGSGCIEMLNKAGTVVFDKTGTLTKGKFKVNEIYSADGYTDQDILKTAVYAEYYSNHPLAKAIKEAYSGEINVSEISDYREIGGKGISLIAEGRQVLVGNAGLMKESNVDIPEFEGIGTTVHIAADGRYAGRIIVSDEIKPDAKKAIDELKKLGIKKTVMLTGDSRSISESIGSRLGIDEVYAELMPAGKVSKLEELYSGKAEEGRVIFVGDGINDAPVLMRADVGIAMGGIGSDAAIEAADAVIMNDEPTKIAEAIRTAKKAIKIAKENIIFAVGVKAFFLILGAVGIATMWEAVFADVGVTFLAVLNSLRTMRRQKD